MIYGAEVGPSEHRSVVGAIETSAAGNIVLRIGCMNTERPDGSWHQTEHVVLTPSEAEQFAAEVLAAKAHSDQDLPFPLP